MSDGVTEVTRRNFDADGGYRIELSPGTYVVDLIRSGIDRGEGLPREVVITSGVLTSLDISIDTGIR